MKIEKAKYEGYLWMSDAQNPQVLEHVDFELEISDHENPFIVEGQLWDKEQARSISIKYVDGKYIYKEYTIKNEGQVMAEVKTFYSNRMDGKKLKFKQYWREEKNEMCENMLVLQPAELVFVGFE
ncbi:MAG: TIGR04423 family type III CRISPR-associated protein [Bacteroidaceae bacterium]|nr:TIGR04423 family type III CRISPR-associated protein [Bacteroidaceae bacterium]